MHGYGASGQGAAPAHRPDLQGQILKADRVVAVQRALELQREDQVQIAARAGGKSRSPLRDRNLKTAVELG